ncbi:MAG: 2-oxo acid dehydrogenase subunit E2 [Tindallia sp. MSAO_Bac2]|nr:MAG: 2-oxo acid dehydrogenase subunit E2 [Tindallia sp. MSAO_Bac2]
MATKVIMPKQGLQMKKGTIRKWLKKEGETVKAEEPLFEIETDKLNIEITSPDSGTLLKITRQEGEVVPITQIIGVIGEAGEDISDLLAEAEKEASKSTSEAPKDKKKTAKEEKTPEVPAEPAAPKRQPGEKVYITPRAKTRAQEAEVDYETITGSSPQGWIVERDILAIAEKSRQDHRSTPVAAKMAREKGISLAAITGTGENGRVTKEDVEKYLASGQATGAMRARTTELIPFEGMRQVIADRMMESLQTSAQLSHRIKVDMSEVIRLREMFKEDGQKISVNDILVKVVSKALMENPMVNASLTEEGILTHQYVNMGIAVAVENGLIVPVIKDADLLTLQEINAAGKELVEKAKTNNLDTEDYTGGTFTISNLGMFDIDDFTAIINPPESAILAVGKTEKTPVVREDEIVIRPMMTLSLTYDHRVIDGAPAAQFLQRVKKMLQNPYLLL